MEHEYEEVNDMEFAGFKFDLFTNEFGSLGITVYAPDGSGHSTDIYVRRDLEVSSL